MSDRRDAHRFTRQLSDDDRRIFRTGTIPAGVHEEPVTRSNGQPISLDVTRDLMSKFEQERRSGKWDKDRAVSDRWLAPRLHHALRLTRSQASDRGLWHWLALVVCSDYSEWRWTGKGGVAADRWYGPIHKQSLARLWWGAEIFRDGADYSPVERAFIRQDLPNSYLHRPIVRCRSLALGIVEVIAPTDGTIVLSSDQVNDLARVINLCTSGRPPEAEVGYQVDDHIAALGWADEDPAAPNDWTHLPLGPRAVDTTERSVVAGRGIAARSLRYAEGNLYPPDATSA
ncbi:DUF6339 family protein [Kribbella sp. NPDC056951]|uniref:DUF6339 family protein n=1 Tax=Kribbella sp. NPDC056951 TaxID=3345978 RepID=UPI003628ADD5